MIILLILVVFGGAIAYFATQNTTGVTISLANYVLENVPLYLVVLGSMFLGLFVAWIISLADGFSSFLTIRSKEQVIDAKNQKVADLEKRVHELELENSRLNAEDTTDHPEPFYKRPFVHT